MKAFLLVPKPVSHAKLFTNIYDYTLCKTCICLTATSKKTKKYKLILQKQTFPTLKDFCFYAAAVFQQNFSHDLQTFPESVTSGLL